MLSITQCPGKDFLCDFRISVCHFQRIMENMRVLSLGKYLIFSRKKKFIKIDSGNQIPRELKRTSRDSWHATTMLECLIAHHDNNTAQLWHNSELLINLHQSDVNRGFSNTLLRRKWGKMAQMLGERLNLENFIVWEHEPKWTQCQLYKRNVKVLHVSHK